MQKRIHCIIRGDVQGVGFRWHGYKEAERLLLTGWIHNTNDGKVECVAEGEEDALKLFVYSCTKGPFYAHVLSCDVTWGEATGEYDCFTIVS